MKRAGFTMIELIFVIVILGILSAVALPKFIGVAEQANAGKLTAYVGTLNRTVAPALWSQSLSEGTKGSILAYATTDIDAQIETPDIGDTVALKTPDPTKATKWSATALSNPATDAELMKLSAIATATLGTTVYKIKALDGSQSGAPRFVLTKTIKGGKEKVVK